jgi:hypothetical protein
MAIFTRAKTVSASAVTSITAEFDEDGGLDSSYTLFAILYISGTAATVTGNSWSAPALGGSGNTGAINYLSAYSVLGNASRNSVTFNFGEQVTSAKVDLYAFQGAETPIMDGNGYGFSTSSSVTSVTYGPGAATTYPNTTYWR